VELFREAAEQFGYIVVGSNNARNGPTAPILAAQAALWKEVHARFSVDPRRSVAAGFSGGARMALRLAEDHRGRFCGVVSLGAYGSDRPGSFDRNLAMVLACGIEDFNHWELLEGAAALRQRGVPVFADRYPGGHRWPTASFATAAMTFLQVRAREAGLVREPQGQGSLLLDGCIEIARAAARAAEANGEPLLALRRFENLATAWAARPEGREARDEIQRLSQLPPVQSELQLEREHAGLRRQLARQRGEPGYTLALRRLVQQLAAAKDPEARGLRRVLNGEGALFFACAAEAMERQDWERAATCLGSQAALQDREPGPCLNLAAALVQLGKPDEAMLHLQEAARRGYRNAKALQAWDLLTGLRKREDFARLLAELEAGPKPPN
jgi:dienelactone hydrolase